MDDEIVESLTHRERVVLIHLMTGLTVDKIARIEHISVATVRGRVRRLLAKMGVSSQVEALGLAYGVFWPTDTARREALERVLPLEAA